jgi:hypothetical protein
MSANAMLCKIDHSAPIGTSGRADLPMGRKVSPPLWMPRRLRQAGACTLHLERTPGALPVPAIERDRRIGGLGRLRHDYATD